MMRTAIPKLFFIGVGNMGNPMAVNLVKAGYPVTVFDVSRAKADNLVALGATWVSSLAEGAAHADVVMASLPGPVQVREVMLGEQGVLAHVKAGTTVIDTSTSAVELVQELVVLANSKGVNFLEAPVTNAVDMAALGRLSIFVGGDKACFENTNPSLMSLVKNLSCRSAWQRRHHQVTHQLAVVCQCCGHW